MYCADNAQTAYNVFHTLFSIAFTTVFPLNEVRILYNNHRNQWQSTGLLKSTKHKNKLFYQSKIKHTEENIQSHNI